MLNHEVMSCKCNGCGSYQRGFPPSEPSPTVTVPREEWERVKVESEAWRATRSEWDRSITLQHAWRSTGRVIAQQIEILDSLTPSNAVEEGSK